MLPVRWHGFSHGAFAEPLGKSGEVFLFSYIKLEVVVFVQDVVAERDSECGKLLVDLTQTGLFGRPEDWRRNG